MHLYGYVIIGFYQMINNRLAGIVTILWQTSYIVLMEENNKVRQLCNMERNKGCVLSICKGDSIMEQYRRNLGVT